MLDVFCAGIGGQGVLTCGRTLANTMMMAGKRVSMVSSYTSEMRGGDVCCSIRVSDETILSPFLEQSDVVIAMTEKSAQANAAKVRSGGLLLTCEASWKPSPTSAFKHYDVPALQLATQHNNKQGANLVMLGAMFSFLNLCDADFRGQVEAFLSRKGRNVAVNMACFDEGARYAANLITAS